MTKLYQAEDLLRPLWGNNQVTAFISAKDTKGIWRDIPVSTVDEAVALAQAEAAKGSDVYMSCAQFNSHESRETDNAKQANGIWLDIDCGEDKAAAGKGYATANEAMRALGEVCKATKLPRPNAIVLSGVGFHVYWLTDNPIPANKWKPTGAKLKALTQCHGFLADDTRTADMASVLRVPGTYHFKDRDDPKPVKLLDLGQPIDAERLVAKIDAAYEAAGRPAIREKAAKLDLPSVTADPELVEKLYAKIKHRNPELMAGKFEEVYSDGMKLGGYNDRTKADYALVGDTVRQGIQLGIPDEMLADAAWQVYERSGLYASDENQADRMRKIVNYAIPNAMTDEISKRVAAQGQIAQMQESDPDAANVLTYEPGDTAAARYFAGVMRGKLIFVAARGKWYRWDGLRWALCEAFEEMRAAKYVAGQILDLVTAQFKLDSLSPRNKKLMAWATSMQGIKRLEATLALAKSEDGMTIGSMAALDADPWLLGVRNGVVNLRDGGLLQADPKMLITRQAAANYYDDTQCPKWLNFLDQVFNGDQETIDYIQRALGYTLTSITTEEVLFICFGHGANGKSVFANVVSTIMADYAQAAPPSLLTVRRNDDGGARGDIARMCGARMASINETQNGDRLDEQVVKMLAGREQISARYNYGEFFDFWPTAKPWLRTNHKPIIVGEDDGIWRRLHLIPFLRKFAEHERDPYLESKLLEERDGILAWMVRGCLEWRRIGLKPSAAVRRESAEYRKDSDLLGEFLDDRTVKGGDLRVERGDFFRAWRVWCEDNGYKSGSQASISRKMNERGFGTAMSSGKRYYTGVGMSPPHDDLLANLSHN